MKSLREKKECMVSVHTPPHAVKPSINTLRGSVSLSPFSWKEDICSLLESEIGAAHWYLFCRSTWAFYKNFPDREMKCNLIGRAIGNREAPAGPIPTAVLVMSHDTWPGVSVSLWLQMRLPEHWPLTWEVNCRQPVGLWLKITVRAVCTGRMEEETFPLLKP